MSRRRMLAAGAGAGVTATAGSLLPPSLRQAMAAQQPADVPGGGGQLGDVRHVVVLMQENRSLDG